MADLTIEPIERSSLVDIVRKRLIELIQEGELQPEQRVVESKLASLLGVSRSPVREALRQLEQQGLVTSSVNRGYSVSLLGLEDLRELTVIRIALERAAVGELMDRGKLDVRGEGRLRSIVAEMEVVAAEPVNLPRCTTLDAEFHEELCQLSGNARLVSLRASMAGQIALALAANNRAFPGTDRFASRHMAVLDAILAGDKKAAEETIEKHILAGLEEQSATARGLEGARLPRPERRETL
jgi:DNA-binding GntR family transcriptional regulator